MPALSCDDRAEVWRIDRGCAAAPVKAIEPASRWPSLKFTLLRSTSTC